ncbi:hypothetical protein QYF68_17760 [Mycolicibacterium austroafricanum]|uniref:AraC-type arabinose-binding/dimerisation domain-containing protein n=2 Tax=Mycolicibacterium austroafricanum TaxID=39687 RepID=A0ABT8HFV1_MYCAO|nr:hypothetical protein [Mycolicibacterium austroafricanum]
MNRSGGGLTNIGPRWGWAALLRPWVLAFAGSIGITDTHAHHAVQIIAATTAFTVLDEHGARHRGTNVVVPADTPHRIEVGAEEGAMVFLRPRGPRQAVPRTCARSAPGGLSTQCLLSPVDERWPPSSTG